MKKLKKSQSTEIDVSGYTKTKPRKAEKKSAKATLEKKPKALKPEKVDKIKKKYRDLEDEMESIEIPENAISNEQLYLDEYSLMFHNVRKLLRKMNAKLQESVNARDIYALSTLISQQREIIADIRSIADMQQHVDALQSQALMPFMSSMTQYITDVYYQLRKLIRETSKPKETQFALNHLDELVKQLGLGLQTSHEEVKASISNVLIGGDTGHGKKKKRH